MSWAAGTTLSEKGRAGQAEGAHGSGSVSRLGLPRGQCELGRGGFGDRAVRLGEAKWRQQPGGAAVVRQGGMGLRRREEGEDDGTYV
jgi:hypothetical protein